MPSFLSASGGQREGLACHSQVLVLCLHCTSSTAFVGLLLSVGHWLPRFGIRAYSAIDSAIRLRPWDDAHLRLALSAVSGSTHARKRWAVC